MPVRVKICGLTTLEDALFAVELGADALGFNFYKGSKRYIDPDRAKAIVAQLPPFVEPVGLFVQSILDEAEAVMNHVGLRTLQWHADPLLPISPQRPWFPAFPVRDRENLHEIDMFLKHASPAAILVDAHVAGQFGGTGQTAPWELLGNYRCAVPLILAGGLTPENVAEAIGAVKPFAVDVASGVENSPGKKDRDKMRRFIDEVKKASHK